MLGWPQTMVNIIVIGTYIEDVLTIYYNIKKKKGVVITIMVDMTIEGIIMIDPGTISTTETVGVISGTERMIKRKGIILVVQDR